MFDVIMGLIGVMFIMLLLIILFLIICFVIGFIALFIRDITGNSNKLADFFEDRLDL